MRGLVCALACLPAGFGVAQATGVRPIGGIVLLGLAALAVRWAPERSRSRRIAWAAVVLVCFVASHILADPLGAWPAVAIVTVAATAAYMAILQPRSRQPY